MKNMAFLGKQFGSKAEKLSIGNYYKLRIACGFVESRAAMVKFLTSIFQNI
jgi:hypothetical protein